MTCRYATTWQLALEPDLSRLLHGTITFHTDMHMYTDIDKYTTCAFLGFVSASDVDFTFQIVDLIWGHLKKKKKRKVDLTCS